MDRIKETTDVIIDLNKYQRGALTDFKLIKSVCAYFDRVKNEILNPADYKFLKYISNISGIPHFYDILEQFNQNPQIESFDLNTFASLFHESTLHIDESNKLHKYQKIILEKFKKEKRNKFFLSASTSFGKTHLIFDLIKKMKYSNIVLIFPTIALLSENLEKILSNKNYDFFDKNYQIHTMSEVNEVNEKNIFIYTPERYLSFIEKTNLNIKFDFIFIDEVYKIDNDYIIDEVAKENERDVAYRLAVFYSLNKNCDILLAGPYIDFSPPSSSDYNNSFDNFLTSNSITLLDFNNYELVNKSFINKHSISTLPLVEFLKKQNKSDRLIGVTKCILNLSQNMIIYCSKKGGNGGVEGYASKLIQANILPTNDFYKYQEFIEHIASKFGEDWILIKSLKQGIGIHHGLIPKYIQKEIINFFNQGLLKILISTTTITEGVNTSAKNLIVMQSKKGNKKLKKFDAKNIAGRAGRFGFHYSGTVIDISDDFIDVINAKPDPIKHKNYDINSPKDEIDLFYSDDQYLSSNDILIKENINKQQSEKNIPDEILNQYKVISKSDKIKVYDAICNLKENDFKTIETLIFTIRQHNSISFEGFQVILNTIRPIVKNKELQGLIDKTKFNPHKNREFAILSNIIYAYLQNGFFGSIAYKKKEQNKKTDTAIKETSKFIYSTLKYQAVKYLGVFNLMYKFYISKKHSTPFHNVLGIDKLLLKFEYNALTNEGRLANDYGVPFSIVDYFEKTHNKQQIKTKFDPYELKCFNKVKKIIKNQE